MSFKGFFYDAIRVGNDFDRKYSAEDYSNILKFVVGNGVVHFDDASLQVVHRNNDPKTYAYTPADNNTIYSIKILSGHGWINGKAFENSSEFSGDERITIINNDGTTEEVTISTIPMVSTGYKRLDRVIVRRDDDPTVRETLPYILIGQMVSSEVEPIGQNFNFAGNGGNDLCIAEILVDYTGTEPVLTINDTRAGRTEKIEGKEVETHCGWVNGYFGDNWETFCEHITQVTNNYIGVKTREFNNWFQGTRDEVATVTMRKKITHSYTVETSGKTFPIDIAEYDPTNVSADGTPLDILNVYTNGIFEAPSDYTINADKTITFNTTKQVDAVIDFVVEKAIDAKWYENPDETMIASVESRFTDIYEKLAKSNELFNEVTYICTGTDDNIAISNIVKTFTNANLTDNARLKINVRGNFGVTRPYQNQIGTPTADADVANFVRWFDFSSSGNRKVIIDFANCSPINISLTNDTYNTIFYGANQEIENCILKAGAVTNTGTKILAVHGEGDVHHKECKYSFICDLSSDLTRHGRFDNCEVTLVSKSRNATAFYTDPIGCVCEVNGGTYWLYSGKDALSAYGTRLVYHSRTTSTDRTPDYSAITILRDVIVPSYTPTVVDGIGYYTIEGQLFKQTGMIFRSQAGAGGHIRATNIITSSDRMANDEVASDTDFIAQGTIPRSTALGQNPFV